MNTPKCTHCNNKIEGRKYCYVGGCYCPDCYTIFFKLKTCSVCHKRKRIQKDKKIPICKSCLYKDAFCIRCNKIVSDRHKVTEYGVVCKSCSKYFRKPKKCSCCQKEKISVSNRQLPEGNELICSNCYTKTLPICSKCHYRRHPLIYDFNRAPICKHCASEKPRHCKYCNAEINPGIGNICLPCSHLKTFKKRVKYGKSVLSVYWADIFEQFSQWFQYTRNIKFAANHINQYFEYFLSLDKLANDLYKLPTYEEIVEQFSVAETRKNLLVTLFLEQINLIPVNKVVKEEHSNLDTIERYLNSFDEEPFFKKIIQEYHTKLHKKLDKNKTSIRSIRLALTPSVKLLKWCTHFGLKTPNSELLHDFLWVSPGQKAAITGFINFLNNNYGLNLIFPTEQSIELKRPSESYKQVKQRFVTILRNKKETQQYHEFLLINALNYLHNISVPKYAWIEIKSIKTNAEGDSYIRLANQIFYLPKLLL